MSNREGIDISLAFEPFECGRLKLNGRLLRAPMWTGTADENGCVTEKTVEHYASVAGNGLGLISTGFAFVSSNSRAVPKMLGASSDDHIPGLASLVNSVHEKGDKISLQIAHCGLNANPEYDPDGLLYGPSLIALTGTTIAEKRGWLTKANAYKMRSLTRTQLMQVMDNFVAAAGRAVKAGFDAVEVHGAHHYLISQFLSPLFNRRTDSYGGGYRQRTQLAIDVVSRIREKYPDLPIIFRMNCEDFVGGGIRLEDSKYTAISVAEAGADIISVSGNNPTKTRIIKPEREAYFREQTKVLKQESGLPVIAAGGIRSPENVISLISEGYTDLVAFGRPLIHHRDLPKRWLAGNFEPYSCISCNGCMKAGMDYEVNCLRGTREDEKELSLSTF